MDDPQATGSRVRCPRCGHESPAGFSNCGSCAARLPDATPDRAAIVAEARYWIRWLEAVQEMFPSAVTLGDLRQILESTEEHDA